MKNVPAASNLSRIAISADDIASCAQAARAEALVNRAINEAARGGRIKITHHRVGGRQPQTEVFVRKIMATVRRLALPVEIEHAAKPVATTSALSGQLAVAEIAARRMKANPTLARYLEPPVPGYTADTGEHGMSRDALFGLLNAYAHREIFLRMAAAPGFGNAAATVLSGLHGLSNKTHASLTQAADSVFSQSFADTYAISLVAAHDGNDAALQMLREVQQVRVAGGDFGEFSLAPLSHDTQASLEILATQLANGKDFSRMTKGDLWANGLWIASEGVGIWMQKHGVEPERSMAMSGAIEALAKVFQKATHTVRNTVSTALRMEAPRPAGY